MSKELLGANFGYMAMVAPMNGEVVRLGGDMVGIIFNAFHLGLLNVALVASLLWLRTASLLWLKTFFIA